MLRFAAISGPAPPRTEPGTAVRTNSGRDSWLRAICAAAFVACAVAAPALAQTATTARTDYDYRLGPKDLVALRVAEIPEISGDIRVTENGTISLPRLGEVPVAGLTRGELVSRLESLLLECCVNRATVEVQIREFRSRPITVIGAVAAPGPLAFSGRWSLLEALTAAGGIIKGHGETVYVLRRSENGLTDQVAIPVQDLLVRVDPRANIPIFANDLINVPVAVDVTVYCLGEVAHPGAVVFTSNEKITLLSTIAKAGGLSDRASNSITIKRKDGQDAGREVKVDYRRIIAGRDPDPPLGNGDILVVKESFF